MKLIIAGSRSIEDYDALLWALEVYGLAERVKLVVSGHAEGVDRLGEEWSKQRMLPCVKFDPKYLRYPKRLAPLIRNQEMAFYADELLAIWDGRSRGTRNMIGCMLALGKPLYVVTWGED